MYIYIYIYWSSQLIVGWSGLFQLLQYQNYDMSSLIFAVEHLTRNSFRKGLFFLTRCCCLVRNQLVDNNIRYRLYGSFPNRI